MKDFLQTIRRKLFKLNANQLRDLLEEMIEEQERFHTLLDSMPSLILVGDIHGKVQYCNCSRPSQQFPIVRPLKKADSMYLWDAIVIPEMAQSIKESVLSKNNIQGEEFEHTCCGAIEYYECSIVPLVQRKIVVGMVVIIIHSTEEHKKAQELTRISKLGLAADVATGIAHELRNPLGAIDIHLQLLKRKIDSIIDSIKVSSYVQPDDFSSEFDDKRQQINKYIGVIEEEINNMSQVVTLFLNNMKQKKLQLFPEDINVVISSFLDLIGPDLHKNHITVTLRLVENIPLVLMARPAITHIFLNLTKNAMESMLDGGALTFETNYDNGKVRVIISDTGHGISEEYIDTIFNPYFTTKDNGTGVGLAVTDKVMQLHSGKIMVNKAYKNGASFILEFPAYAATRHRLPAPAPNDKEVEHPLYHTNDDYEYKADTI